MLKFIKGHMTSIDGIEIFPVLSFVIFFSFFVAVTVWIYTMKKSKVDEIAHLPLENGNDYPFNKNSENEK